MATTEVSLHMTPSHPGDFVRIEVIEELASASPRPRTSSVFGARPSPRC